MSDGFGRFDGKTHILPLRIYYEDTDLSGVVYHANYLRFMERGRSEYFRCAGIARLAMLEDDEPTAWTLRKITVGVFPPGAGRRPDRGPYTLRQPDRARGWWPIRRSTLRGQLLMRGMVEACIITMTGRPRRIPAELRRKLAPFVTETGS